MKGAMATWFCHLYSFKQNCSVDLDVLSQPFPSKLASLLATEGTPLQNLSNHAHLAGASVRAMP